MNQRFNIIKHTAFQALVIIFLAIIISLIVNSIRPDGLRILHNQNKNRADDTGIPKINVNEVIQKSDNPNVLLIDARPKAEYLSGHIEGAKNLPYNEFDDRIENFITTVEPQTQLIVYCSGPHCSQATQVGELLMEMGYETILYFPGGMEEWVENKQPVETER